MFRRLIPVIGLAALMGLGGVADAANTPSAKVQAWLKNNTNGHSYKSFTLERRGRPIQLYVVSGGKALVQFSNGRIRETRHLAFGGEDLHKGPAATGGNSYELVSMTAALADKGVRPLVIAGGTDFAHGRSGAKQRGTLYALFKHDRSVPVMQVINAKSSGDSWLLGNRAIPLEK